MPFSHFAGQFMQHLSSSLRLGGRIALSFDSGRRGPHHGGELPPRVIPGPSRRAQRCLPCSPFAGGPPRQKKERHEERRHSFVTISGDATKRLASAAVSCTVLFPSPKVGISLYSTHAAFHAHAGGTGHGGDDGTLAAHGVCVACLYSFGRDGHFCRFWTSPRRAANRGDFQGEHAVSGAYVHAG